MTVEKILLILESEEMERSLRESLVNYEVRTCTGETAADTLRDFQPDALVLDLFLPGMDGFTLMETCDSPLPPCILLLTVLNSDYIQKKAAYLGVDFVIRKPCSVHYILRHLTDMLMACQFSDLPDDETLVEHLLTRLHIHGKGRVRKALTHAILMCAKDPDCLLTKEIYWKISPEYGASRDAVDQAIRRCLRNAWHNRYKEAAVWDQFFPDCDTCPTNWTFISTLAACLHKKYPSRFRKGS